MSKKFPRPPLGKKTDPEPPLEPPFWLRGYSNGEYIHVQTPREGAMRREVLRRADEGSRRVGMGRREFLASSMGIFTSLAVFNEMGCGTDEKAPSKWGQPYVVPPEATCDPAHELLLHGNE